MRQLLLLLKSALLRCLRRFPFAARWLRIPRGVVRARDDSGAQGCTSYRAVHPAHVMERRQPRYGDTASVSLYDGQKRVTSPETFVLELANARLFGSPPAILTSDDQLIEEVSHGFTEDIWAHPALRCLRLPAPKRFPGRAAVLSMVWGNVYFHWLFDVLPRLQLIRLAGYQWNELEAIVVNSVKLPFQREMINLLGLPLDRFVASDEMAYSVFDSMVVPSLPGTIGSPAQWVCTFLREAFLPYRSGSGAKRIFIKRGKAKLRRLLNEEEVCAALIPEGFKIVSLEDLSFVEQVSLFAGAEVVVGVHGSGFSNIVFSPPGVRVVEIFHPRGIIPCYWNLAEQVDALYSTFLSCEGVPGLDPAFHHADIVVDVNRLMSFLRAMSMPVSA